MISLGELLGRIVLFACVVLAGNIAGYLIPYLYATQPSYHANFDLTAHQSAKIDMYADLDASSLTIFPSAGTKFELTDVEPQVKTTPLKLHGVKLSLDTEDRMLFENLSLHEGSDVTVSFNWHAQYGEQDGAFILESNNFREIGQVKTNVQSTHVFGDLPAGIYTLSAQRQSTGASSLNYEVTGTIARYKTQGVPEICTRSCKWSRRKHGAQYAVITAGGQDGSAAMDGYFTYPHQLLFQSAEIVIFVVAFVIAFVVDLPSFSKKSMAKVASKEKGMLQV